MTLTRDTIQFLIDQVDRFYLTNRSVDDLLNTIDLPPAVAAIRNYSLTTTAGSG